MKQNETRRGALFVISLICLCAVNTTPVTAQERAGGQQKTDVKPPEPTPLQKEFRKYDLNGNGKLEPAERQAYLAARAKARADSVKKWDRNGDGKLDETERGRAHAAWRKALKDKRAAAAASTPPPAPAKKP
ncbi:MAG: hypothetical protein HY674_20820 [Chloroflexi bacterium]|nr:hypothetical protein [Chloroflexota bacterium]